MKRRVLYLVLPLLVAGCKYYGSALPSEYPMSMDNALAITSGGGTGGAKQPVVRQATRPRIERPSYLPEKELALVTPPKTLLLWTFPHITDDNTRVFGSWSTIFLNDRYEWARPANELGNGQDDAGAKAGRPGLGDDDAPGPGVLGGRTAVTSPQP
jgi:hypothetical protein